MDYLDFFSAFPHLSWINIISLFLLVFMRLVPIISIAPFLGGKVTPIPAKAGLTICLSLIFLPTVTPIASPSLVFNIAYLGYAIKELFIGLILGFIISIPFYIVQTSGILIDYLRGASMMQSQDPSMQTQASPIGILYNYVLIVIFFHLNGPFLLFESLIESYHIIPPDGLLNPIFFKEDFPFWQMTFDLLNRIAKMSIQLAAPALIAILMAEMFLGIANRLAPQVQIVFLGMSIKSLLGLSLLATAWFFLLKQFAFSALNWLDIVKTIIKQIKMISLPL